MYYENHCRQGVPGYGDALPILAIWLTQHDLIPIPGSDFGGWGIAGFAGVVGFLLGFLWRSLWPFAIIFVVWIGYSVVVLATSEDTARTDPEVSVATAGFFGFIPAMAGAAVGALIGRAYEYTSGGRL